MQVISVSPNPDSADIVLGQPIEVVFDTPLDPASVTTATFALYGPSQTDVPSGREYVAGSFSFPEPNRLVFTPSRPLRPEVVYTVTLAGGGSILATTVIRSNTGEPLVQSYTFRFTTGTLNLEQPPILSPVPAAAPPIPTDQIRLLPQKVFGNALEEIWIVFPADIDCNSIDASYSGLEADENPFNDIVVTLEALLNDPTVTVPSNPTFSVAVEANVLKIRLLP